MGWLGGDVNIQRPETASYGESLREALTAQVDLAPELYAAEASREYGRPAYAQMEAGLMTDVLRGQGAGRLDRVKNLYQSYLGREPDPTGLMEMMQSGLSDAEMEKKIAESPEAISAYTTNLYQAHMGREPDAAGLKFIKDEGLNLSQIRDLVTGSPEAKKEASRREREGEPPAAERMKPMGPEVMERQGMIELMGSTKPFADGRKPGFSKEGKFEGMTVLGEDLRQQAASAQREGDIADVQANLAAYQKVMKDARPETVKQLNASVKVMEDEAKRLEGDKAIITDPNLMQKVAQNLQGPAIRALEKSDTQVGRDPLGQMKARARDPVTGVGRGGPIGGGGPIPGEPPMPGILPAQQAGGPQRWALAEQQAQQAQMGGQPEVARHRPTDPYAEVMRGGAGELETGYRPGADQLEAGFRGQADQMALGERGTADRMGGYSALSDPFGLRQTMQQQAAEDLAAGRGLSPRQRREAEQSARRWGQAAGRGLDPLSAVREVEELMEMRGTEEARRRAFAGQVIGQEAALQTGELGRGMQQAGFNIQNEVARREANLGRRLTEQEFNTMQDTARREANIGREMGAGQFNIQQEVARREANIGREMGAGQFNIQQEVSRQEANLGRRLSAQEFNTLQDAARQEADIARATEAERFNIGMGEQRTEADIARDLALQQYNIGMGEERRAGDIGREMQGAGADITQKMQQEQMNEQLRQRQLQGYLGGVGQVAGMEQQMLGDPLQAIIGRPAGGAGFGMGQQMYGGSQYGLTSGPGVAFNPEAGLSYMLGQQGNEANLLAAEAGASAQKSAGMMGGIGAMAGGFLGNPGLFK